MNWPFVSRRAYDLALADRDYFRSKWEEALTPKEKVVPPAAPLKATAQSDEEIVREAEQNFISKATRDLSERYGIHPSVAAKEAKRIREEIVTVTA